VIPPDHIDGQRIPLSWSQRNIYNGVLQDGDPALYLIGRRYRFACLELAVLLAALEATIDGSPVQLCVLEPPPSGDGYPDLVPRLRAADLVDVRPDDEYSSGGGGEELQRSWQSGILATPLVRYTVRVDDGGRATGLDVYTHHLLLDGGATGLIEADLGRHIASGGADDVSSVGEGLTKLAEAHRCEARRVAESRQRLADAAKREIAGDAGKGGYGQTSRDAPGTAAKGVLRELVSISGAAYDAILAVAETEQVPLNVLVAAAAVAVDASLRQSTESLLVHAVDNRFGDPDLNVATCLVNSVAQSVRFPAFASLEDVVDIDRRIGEEDTGHDLAVPVDVQVAAGFPRGNAPARDRAVVPEVSNEVSLARHHVVRPLPHPDALLRSGQQVECEPAANGHILEQPDVFSASLFHVKVEYGVG